MVAIGLTIIFGVMKVLNVTHGSLYAFGAYFTATLIGMYYETDLPESGGFLILLLAPIVLGVVMGVLIERGVLRFLYSRDEHTIVLATFAAFLVLDADNGRHMNHSEAPNTDFRDLKLGYAIADIEPGEEITCNYAEFEPEFEILPPVAQAGQARGASPNGAGR